MRFKLTSNLILVLFFHTLIPEISTNAPTARQATVIFVSRNHFSRSLFAFSTTTSVHLFIDESEREQIKKPG